MNILPKPDPMADMRRAWAAFQTEIIEFQMAARVPNILDMDYSRSMVHTLIDRYLDCIATGYAVELIKQQGNA